MKLGLGLGLMLLLAGCGAPEEVAVASKEGVHEMNKPEQDNERGKPEKPGKPVEAAGGAGGSASGSGGAGGAPAPEATGGTIGAPEGTGGAPMVEPDAGVPGTGGAPVEMTGGSMGTVEGTGGAPEMGSGGTQGGTGGAPAGTGGSMMGTGGAGGSAGSGGAPAGTGGSPGTGGTPVVTEAWGNILVLNGPNGIAQTMPGGSTGFQTSNLYCGGNGNIKKVDTSNFRPLRWSANTNTVLGIANSTSKTVQAFLVTLDLTTCKFTEHKDATHPTRAAAYAGGFATMGRPWPVADWSKPLDLFMNGVKMSDEPVTDLDVGSNTICYSTPTTIECNDIRTMDKPVTIATVKDAWVIDVSASGSHVAYEMVDPAGGNNYRKVVVASTVDGKVTQQVKCNLGASPNLVLSPKGTRIIYTCKHPTTGDTRLLAPTPEGTVSVPWNYKGATLADWR